MSGIRAKPQIDLKPYAYGTFQGLDTSRDIAALDTGDKQHLAILNNGFCDWRGQIVRDPTYSQRTKGGLITHVNFISRSDVVWVERTGKGLTFESERGHVFESLFPRNAVVSTTVFNQKMHFMARAMRAVRYDGVNYSYNTSVALDTLRPGFVMSIQRRLAVAGIVGKETQIHFSRVDQDQVFPADETGASDNVLRANYVDIANLVGKAEPVTGLGTFEINRAVIFTTDRALLYRIDPDITNWMLDERANINIGCISHNTIQTAGTDILFCSRSGIHSIRRSVENGIMVYSYPMSDKIDTLYRSLLRGVNNQEEISAVFDQDEGQYHVFFPQGKSNLCTRLTLTLNAQAGEVRPSFSTATFLNARCGVSLAGQLVFGTPGGLYNVNKVESDDGDVPPLEFVTPLLWHGSMIETKQTNSMILQASGKGTLIVDAISDEGRPIGSLRFEVADTDDSEFSGMPLIKQYERKWEHRYRGAMYRFRTEGGSGHLRVTGLAITVRKQ